MNEDEFTKYSKRSDEDENRIWDHHIHGKALPDTQEA